MTLGQRIAQYRKATGLSQEVLGERVGVSRQAVSKWETDAAAPDMENLIALARIFGVSLAELTETPEPPPETQPVRSGPRRVRRPLGLFLGCLLALVLITMGIYVWSNRNMVPSEEAVADPSPFPATEFALLWSGSNGYEEFLELGVQEDIFPFGRELALTEPEEVLDTDYPLTTLHRADCGDMQLEYLHIGSDPESAPESPEQESVTKITTIVPGYTTPRGIGVGSSKADVIAAYGGELVYCLKEEGAPLVRHDYYYAYQTPETFGLSLCLYMRDGLVAGIKLEDMLDAGNQAYTPDNVTRFPAVNGDPDFSRRQEPEREDIDDTRKVYIAWNRLVTNKNLSAEEIYEYRRDVFSLLPEMDWGELGQVGSAEDPDSAIFGLMSWLENQAPYSSAEILWVQMGCTAQGLDGAYTDSYCRILSRALFSDPVTFSKSLATDGVDEVAKSSALRLTAYDAELYPVESRSALDTLDAALADGSLTQTEQGWAKLLRLYLTTPIDDRSELPKTPTEME